jgi:hypothetical protein
MSNTTATPALRAIGFNDEQDHCDRCGKPELKGTVILADEDNTEAGRYGTSCAAKIIAESTGVKVTVTRNDALRTERNRRDTVMNYLRKASAALADNDPAIAQWFIWDMRRDAVAVPHRADELAIVAAVDATGTYTPTGVNRSFDEIRAAALILA